MQQGRLNGYGGGGLRRAAGRTTRRPIWARFALAMAAAVALVAGIFAVAPPAAEAVPKGESLTLPGGMVISNFVLPNGKRAYCLEITMGEPTGRAWSLGSQTTLPGRPGLFGAWGNEAGMRQMNYLIDVHGQSRDKTTAAAVQLTIWRMREGFTASNAQLNRTIAQLQASSSGRSLIARSDALYAEAKKLAVAPAPAPVVTGKLVLSPDRLGRSDVIEVAFPSGATSMSVTGGKFMRNGERTLGIDQAAGSWRRIKLDPGAKSVSVNGSWRTQSRVGWPATLEVYNTTTASGGVGQRIAAPTAKSKASTRSGVFAAATYTPVTRALLPIATTQAQPSAEVGGTMVDTLLIGAQPGATVDMWQGATASFTAYLEPTAGAIKYDDSWQPVLGEAYETQADDPATGEPLWHTWWADQSGEALLDAAGAPIPAVDEAGQATTGIAANGIAYPVTRLDDSGEPMHDSNGSLLRHTARTPVMKEQRDPQRWSEEELGEMSDAERCLAQPVHVQSGLEIPGTGSYQSEPVIARTVGTINWVERITSQGTTVHEGTCGVANERTKIGQPGVETKAPAMLTIGELATDVATVTGTLAPGANYTLTFEAYKAGEQQVCTRENRLFKSERVPVTGSGNVTSPGFTLAPEHVGKIWWVETLEVDAGDGPTVLHRGVCALPNETTEVTGPNVTTKALEHAVAGDLLTDTATLTGRFAENDGAKWELSFAAYRGPVSEAPAGDSGGDGDASDEAQEEGRPRGVDDEANAVKDQAQDPDPSESTEPPPAPPQCTADNLLFEGAAVPVTGPGEVTSAPVIAKPEWAGTIWWVETLWLVQNGERTEYLRGECGLVNETTFVEPLDVHTAAVSLARLGDKVSDTAEVTGQLTQRAGTSHEMIFAAYRGTAALTGTEDAVCTAENEIWRGDAIAVTSAGTIVSDAMTLLPDHGDTVWWVEELWLVDASAQSKEPPRTLLHRGGCGLPNETTTVQWPTVTTEATAKVRIGDDVYDTAIVEGPITENSNSELWVRFDAYRRDANGTLTCTPDSAIEQLSDQAGARVTAAGRYESKKIRATSQLVGLGGYVETLVLKHAGNEYLVHQGQCGAPNESFEILPTTTTKSSPKPPLTKTGTGRGAAIGLAALLVTAALAAGVGATIRRRGRKNP